jgi:hypothetical protein
LVWGTVWSWALGPRNLIMGALVMFMEIRVSRVCI